MSVLATRFEPSAANSNVKKATHSTASWRNYVLFHLLFRVAIYLRKRKRQSAGTGNISPAGPQDFSELLEMYKKGKDKYAQSNGVHLDWYLPASESDFASSQYFDWSTIRVLRFRPKDTTTGVKRIIFYLNGGGFIQPATAAHSYICSLLAHRLNACVFMFPYELAPTGIAASQLPKLTDFYLRISARAREQGHEVIIGGDSAGGAIASSMPVCIQRFAPLLLGKATLSEEEIAKLQPNQLILISPLSTCDIIGNVREEMNRIQPQDWWLTVDFADEVCALWVGSGSVQEEAVQHFVTASKSDQVLAEKWRKALPLRVDDAMVDPIGSPASLELLHKSKVHITLLCGTSDILYSCAYFYAKRCEEKEVSCTFIEGLGGLHVYPLLTFLFSDSGYSKGADLIISSVREASRFE